jgi:hypothetical protein
MKQHGTSSPIGGAQRFRPGQPDSAAPISIRGMTEGALPEAASMRGLELPRSALPPMTDFCLLLEGTSAAHLPSTADSLAVDFGKGKDQERYTLIAKLGMRMLDGSRQSDSPVAPGHPPPAAAGYTYLGQFIAHDLSFAAERIPKVGVGGVAPEVWQNLRESLLSLETIYGGGPRQFPLAYACPWHTGKGSDDRREPSDRTHLRLGRLKPAGAPDPDVQTAFDLPRLALPEIDSGRPLGPSDVLIPDPRNDDHALISQIAVQFCRLHNRIADAIIKAERGEESAPGRKIDYAAIFDRARAATTWIYRTIVWNDYLRIMLDPGVYRRYAPRADDAPARTVRFLTTRRPGQVPVEFSHAAFRFGHAMVRHEYRLRGPVPFKLADILKQKSADHPAFMPFNEDWLIEWRTFFDDPSRRAANEAPPDLVRSRPLGPSAHPMGDNPVFLADKPDDFGDYPALSIKVCRNGRPSGPAGLATRDLARGLSVPTAAVSAILEVMQEDAELEAVIAGAGGWLGDAAGRAAMLRAWLDRAPDGCGDEAKFSPAELGFLAGDPPLFFFVLFEAGHATLGKGARLGPVGSFIVAETMLRNLADVTDDGVTASYRSLLVPPARVGGDLRLAFAAGAPETMFDLVGALGA